MGVETIMTLCSSRLNVGVICGNKIWFTAITLDIQYSAVANVTDVCPFPLKKQYFESCLISKQYGIAANWLRFVIVLLDTSLKNKA